MATILYSIAQLSDGQLIKANDAEKGIDYSCPVCEGKMILRKSGKTGKNTKRPHFAHKALSPNCTPESALHYAFKMLAAEKIRTHLINKQPIPISWHCEYCDEWHSGDLLKHIYAVEVEHYLGACRPDIALIDKKSKVFAVIEVVVTHAPEEQALDYYQKNEVILVQVDLQSDLDLEEIDAKLSEPDRIDACLNPRCPVCRQYMQRMNLSIITGRCWSCHEEMKVAVLERQGKGTKVEWEDDEWHIEFEIARLPPSGFSADQRTATENHGVILKKQYSKKIGKSYLANTCPHCDNFVGEAFLHAEFALPAEYGEYSSESVEVGYSCWNCS